MNSPETRRPVDPDAADLDRVFARVRDRRAPATLSARVMAAVAAERALAARPWWRRDALHWPLAAQVAAGFGALGATAGVTFAGVVAQQAVAERLALLQPLAEAAGLVATVARESATHALAQPLVLGALGVLGVAVMSTTVLGAALVQVARRAAAA